MTTARRPSTDADAIAWLVAQVPELTPLLDEHVAFYEELLPYVLFESDFVRWFIDRVKSGDIEPARRFIESAEPRLTTDVVPPACDRVWNLAAVCLVEGLRNEKDVVAPARPWMAPNTSKAFDTVGPG